MKQVRGWQSGIAAAEQKKSAGFTLMELLITVAIGMIMTVIALPLLVNGLAGYRLRGAVASMTGIIQATRYQAIFNGYPFQVVINSVAMTYQVKSDPTRTGAFSDVCVGGAVSPCPVSLAGSSAAVAINASTTLTFSPGGSVSSTTAAGGVTAIIVTYSGKQETINVSSYGNTKVTMP